MRNAKLVGNRPGQVAIGVVVATLLVVAALLLLRLPAEAQTNDRAVGGVTLTSPNPGELVITWDAPSNAPDDYRLTWKKSDGKWHSYKNANTVEGGNAFPTGTSHTVTGLEEGTEYRARVRARYFDDNGNLEQSGPWSDAVEITISATPSQDGEGDSNEGPSTSAPAKPTGLLTGASHDNVLLAWDNPDDDTITGYQVLRGPDTDSLTVLLDDTESAGTSHTDDTVEAETTYVYAVRGRNAHGLGPQSDPVSATTPAAPPAKPTGLLTAASHDSVLLSWDNPDDDTITGYQILRGLDADNLAVLADDTGDANTSYTDSTVEAETTYVYAVRARNAHGLGLQSDPVTVTTLAATEEDEPPTSARALAGAEFTLDGKDLDTSDSNCLEDTIGDIMDSCTINIDTTRVTFAVDGTLDSDDRLSVKIGRDKAAVDAASTLVDASDLRGTDEEETLTFQVGRNLMRLWGFEPAIAVTTEEHFYRVNVVPYWELDGDRLSKSDDCRSEPDRTAAQITDDDCIVTQVGNAPKIRFFNVITDQFNVYVHVNGTQVITEPGDSALAGSFTLDLQDGDNVVKVRLASKSGDHHAETYGNNRFHYKVKVTDVLVSNLGQSSSGDFTVNATTPGVAVQFTTGRETAGYSIGQVRLDISADSGTVPKVSIYSDSSGQPGSSLKILTNRDAISTSRTELGFGADNYKLDPRTPYWIVVERASGSGAVTVSYTSQTGEETGSAAGWNIGDKGSSLSSGTWSTGRIPIPRIAVKGRVVSTDATLSALALKDASDRPIALTPAFASGTTSYTATVAGSVSRIKIGPTANDSNATIAYLNDSNVKLPDADTNTAVFDLDLVGGSDVVKVKVTAEDTTTTRTYTLRIGRAATDQLLSNLRQTTAEVELRITNSAALVSDIPSDAVAVMFTTGDEPGGYRLSTLHLVMAKSVGSIPQVSVYTDNSGEPGTSLKTLTNPASIRVGLPLEEVQFDADNYPLQSNTSYWIVIEDASTAGVVFIGQTTSSEEDASSLPDWEIGSAGKGRKAGTWKDVRAGRFTKFEIRGTSISGSAVATLSALALKDASDNAIALDPTFATATTSYTATVPNSVSRIRVVFDFDPSEGPNVVKITGEDTTTTYTLRIRRTPTDQLLSNLGQTSAANQMVISTNDLLSESTIVATMFTTGDEPTGYAFSALQLLMSKTAIGSTQVSVYTDNSGEPGASLTTLTNPASIPTSLEEVQFDADDYLLQSNTSYWIVIEETSAAGATVLAQTTSSEGDAGSLPDWEIGSAGKFRTAGTWVDVEGGRVTKFAIRGRLASADATLSVLALKDARDNPVALDPTFAAATTSYTATVPYSVSGIKVEPTANHSNATIAYLDDRNETLPDAVTRTSVFDLDLSVGENVVKVRVTAEDGTTTETYTVRIRKEKTLAKPSTARANATVVTLGDVFLSQRHAVAEGDIPSGGNQNQWARYSVTAGRYYIFEVWGVGRAGNEVGGTLDDPSLRVETMSGAVLGSDDNSGDGKNALLQFFAVTTQDVILRISDAADPDAGGHYTLLITEERLHGERADCSDDLDNTTCSFGIRGVNGEPIYAAETMGASDGRVEGWLSAGDSDIWRVGIQGHSFTDKGTFRIWVVQFPPSQVGALHHPRVQLYDNNDNLLAENDHHLGTRKAKIRYKEIAHDDTRDYYVKVTSTDGGAGAYAIEYDVYDTP